MLRRLAGVSAGHSMAHKASELASDVHELREVMASSRHITRACSSGSATLSTPPTTTVRPSPTPFTLLPDDDIGTPTVHLAPCLIILPTSPPTPQTKRTTDDDDVGGDDDEGDEHSRFTAKDDDFTLLRATGSREVERARFSAQHRGLESCNAEATYR